jgi:hypothetical protein
MKLKFVAAIAIVATVTLAHAQQGGAPASTPKPTKAEVEKVVQTITSDKANAQVYCDLNKTYDQLQEAEKKARQQEVEALSKQADALVDKLGLEYSKMIDGLDQVDPNSDEGKEYISLLSGLDKLCTK